MNLISRLIKILLAQAHTIVSKFEDPIKLIEQAIRDLKKDFDESMKNVAQIKAISIGLKKDMEVKKQIAADYEQKAMLLLKKAKNNELDQKEADRLATEALKKRQEALTEVQKLSGEIKTCDTSLETLEKKILELKNKIKQSENEYNTLKARAAVAKTAKKVNRQLSEISADSTLAMIEEMKTKIQAEENLAEAYAKTTAQTSIDDEINKAIGCDVDVQHSLEEMKQKLLANPDNDIDSLKKELD